jgi:hypothetical protein
LAGQQEKTTMKEPAYAHEPATEPSGEPRSSGSVLTREARRGLLLSLIRLIQSSAAKKGLGVSDRSTRNCKMKGALIRGAAAVAIALFGEAVHATDDTMKPAQIRADTMIRGAEVTAQMSNDQLSFVVSQEHRAFMAYTHQAMADFRVRCAEALSTLDTEELEPHQLARTS